MSNSQATPMVFISYSHKDEEWKERLVKQLRVFGQQLLIEIWDDRHIKGGDYWQTEIQTAMDTASLAVVMVSADSLTSDFILNQEIPYLLGRQRKAGLPILPIIVRETNWKVIEWLKNIQVLPKDGRPLAEHGASEIDKALTEIASQIYTRVCVTNFDTPPPLPLPGFSHEEERLLDGLLQYIRKNYRPPKVTELTLSLQDNSETFRSSIERLKAKNWIEEYQGLLVFTPDCYRDWPPLAITDLNRAMAVVLDARHVSTHFRVNDRRLIAPWTTCYTCFVQVDIATNLERQGGLTAYMVSNNGIYNLDREQILAFTPLRKETEEPPPISPVYGEVCWALLAKTIIIDGQEVGLVKVENKHHSPETRLFTKFDQSVFDQVIEHEADAYRKAWQWMMKKYPDPQVHNFEAHSGSS